MTSITRFVEYWEDLHFPYFIMCRVQRISPGIARLLKYGRYNPNTRDYWNERFRSEGYARIEDKKYGLLRREILRFIPANSRVLDLGCGTGRFMELLTSQKSCQCSGLDISDVSIELVRQKGFEGFLSKLPHLPTGIVNRRFDVCVLIETLEHLTHPERTLKIVAGLLKPSGLLIISVPDGCMKPEVFDEHVSAFDGKSLAALIPSGISIETITTCECADYKYLILIGKKSSIS